MLNDTFAKRFIELEQSYSKTQYESDGFAINSNWHQWTTSAQSLIGAVCGESSHHSVNFKKLYGECNGHVSQLGALFAVFMSAKQDFEGGYIFNVDLRVSGEVFGDFVTLAKQSLAEGHKDVAAVLACAALEDALKRFAIANNLDVTDKTMSDVVNALKGARLVAGGQKNMLDTMPAIRNHALHARWDKLSEPDVNSVIGFVEQFLLNKFSG